MSERDRAAAYGFHPPLLGLELEPTIAMRRGKQLVYQCAECGLLAIQTDLAPGPLGDCPACGRRSWWREEIPAAGSADSLAGLRQGASA